MTGKLSDADIRLLRARAQGLAGSLARDVSEPDGPGPDGPASDVPGAVALAGAVQAQNRRAARLAVRVRTCGPRRPDAAAVDLACDVSRSVVRTWAMRGTLHMLRAQDVRWLVRLLGPGNAAAGRRRRLQLGLDDELCARALPALAETLADGVPRSRAALVQSLAGRGVVLDLASQQPPHLLGLAAARGLICRGPDLARDEPSYVLLDAWVPADPVDGTVPDVSAEPDAALAELARRYFRAYGPATVADFAAWSGLPMGQARLGHARIADELDQAPASGAPLWAPADMSLAVDEGDRRQVRLLGHFDPCLLGYRGRDLVVDPRHARRVQTGGMIQPVLLAGGQALGGWSARRARAGLVVTVEPFEPLDSSLLPGVEAEAADLGRFLDVSVDLRVSAPG